MEFEVGALRDRVVSSGGAAGQPRLRVRRRYSETGLWRWRRLCASSPARSRDESPAGKAPPGDWLVGNRAGCQTCASENAPARMTQERSLRCGVTASATVMASGITASLIS